MISRGQTTGVPDPYTLPVSHRKRLGYGPKAHGMFCFYIKTEQENESSGSVVHFPGLLQNVYGL